MFSSNKACFRTPSNLGVCFGSRAGQGEPEPASLAGRALDANPTALLFHVVLGDGEADAAQFDTPVQGTLELVQNANGFKGELVTLLERIVARIKD